MRHLQQQLFLQHAGDQLDADRQSLLVKAAGHTDRRQAGHIGWNGEQVGQVHGQGILTVGPEAEGGAGGGGRQQHIHAGEGPLKIAADQAAHLLGLLVISIHIARREGVGADQDAALHLIAKTLGPAAGGHLRQTAAGLGAIAILNAVVAGQVGAGLRRGDHVVGGDAVVEAGAAQLHQLAAQGLQLLGRGQHRRLHLGIQARRLEALADQTHLQARHRLLQGGPVIGHRCLEAGGIAAIRPGDHLQQLGCISHRTGKRPHLVEGTGKGHQAVAADAAVGGLEPHHAAEGGGLANRAAGVGTQGGDALPSRHGRGATAGTAAGHPLGIPGVATGTKGGGLGGAAHGELVEVGLAEQHGAGSPKAVGDGGLVGRYEILQHAAGAGGADALGAEVVLDRQGHAGQGRQRLAGGPGPVDALGIGAGPLCRHLQIGVDGGLHGADAGEVQVGELPGRHLAPTQLLTPLGDPHPPGYQLDGRYQSEPISPSVNGSPRRVRSNSCRIAPGDSEFRSSRNDGRWRSRVLRRRKGPYQ